MHIVSIRLLQKAHPLFQFVHSVAPQSLIRLCQLQQLVSFTLLRDLRVDLRVLQVSLKLQVLHWPMASLPHSGIGWHSRHPRFASFSLEMLSPCDLFSSLNRKYELKTAEKGQRILYWFYTIWICMDLYGSVWYRYVQVKTLKAALLEYFSDLGCENADLKQWKNTEHLGKVNKL